jgi:hypothetical protein
MGDKFEDIRNSAIATRGGSAVRGDRAKVFRKSELPTALNGVGQVYGPDVQRALEKIIQYLEIHDEQHASNLLRNFVAEIAKPKANKSLMREPWSEFKAVLPAASEIASALKVVAQVLF